MQHYSVLSGVVLQTILLATTSLCILLAADARHRRLAWAWVFSNVLSAVSLYSYPVNQPDAPTLINATNSALALVAISIKYVCLSTHASRFFKHRPILSLIASMALMPPLIYLCGTPLRLLFLCGVGMALVAASVVAVSQNRAWSRLPAKKLVIATFVASFIMLAWRIQSAYPFGEQSAFIGTHREQIIGLAALVAGTVFLQIGFLGLITGRMERFRQVSEKRKASAEARSRALQDFNQQLERASQERLVLLQVLTHEVRQPLNNAQAAIQTILTALKSTENKILNPLVLRTQDIIDSVTLALSNAITGASLLYQKGTESLHYTDISVLVELTTHDCPVSMQHRINIILPTDPIFAIVDPGLMRLALRNLMDNAIKYSPEGTEVDVELQICNERMGALFSVSNDICDPFHLKGDIFGLKARGENQMGQGDGIGLYVVSQVARVHRGSISFTQPTPNRVIFELFIPI